MNDFSNLPTSWQIKTLGEVCVSTNSNITFKNIQDKKGDYPIYGASGVVAYVDFYTKENQSLGIVKDGAGIGRVFLLPPKASVIGTLHYVENNDDLNLKYLFYFLQSINLARYITGSAIPHIYFRDWKKEQIPLPPLEIQKRIVARLESAFEKIEKGSAHLQNAKTKLAKYKQSLLKSAFDGTLFCHTEGEARSISNQESRDISLTLNMTNSPSLRANEASVAIHESKVDCHDLTSSNLAMTDKENPKLPQGWTIKTLGEIGEIVTGSTPNTKNREYYGDEYPFYKPTDLNLGYCVENSSDMVSSKGFEISRKLPSKSILVTCIGATIGKTGLIRNAGICNQQINAIIPKQNICPEFVYFYCISNAMQELIKTNASATTLPILNKTAFSKLPIPLPPLEIQKQIVKLLEKHLQHANKTGEFIESALNKAKQLKQSLLKSAFAGELV